MRWKFPVSVTNAAIWSPSESMPVQIPPGEAFITAGGGSDGGGDAAPPPPPPQAAQNADKFITQRNRTNAFMLLVQVWRQPGDLGVLRGVVPWLLGGSEDPWLSVPAFRRVWLCRGYALSVVEDWLDRRTLNIIGTNSSDSNGRFGSLADL